MHVPEGYVMGNLVTDVGTCYPYTDCPVPCFRLHVHEGTGRDNRLFTGSYLRVLLEYSHSYAMGYLLDTLTI